MKLKTAFAAAMTALACASAFAQGAAYPNRPITLIVGFPPGGGADSVALEHAQQLIDAAELAMKRTF